MTVDLNENEIDYILDNLVEYERELKIKNQDVNIMNTHIGDSIKQLQDLCVYYKEDLRSGANTTFYNDNSYLNYTIKEIKNLQ